MTTKELERRVSISAIGCGTYRITTEYLGWRKHAIQYDMASMPTTRTRHLRKR